MDATIHEFPAPKASTAPDDITRAAVCFTDAGFPPEYALTLGLPADTAGVLACAMASLSRVTDQFGTTGAGVALILKAASAS